MFVAYSMLAVLMSAMLVLSGRAKLVKDEQIVTIINGTVGVPTSMFPALAAAEFAGAVGLLAGLVYLPLGVAAALGVVLYFVGAVVSHLRVGDASGSVNALVMIVPSVAVLVLALLAL